MKNLDQIRAKNAIQYSSESFLGKNGGETSIENGRFTLARQAGMMKLYVFVGGEASLSTQG